VKGITTSAVLRNSKPGFGDGVISICFSCDFSTVVFIQPMEQQEVNSIMSMVDGVVAMVMDEDEVDAVLVVVVVFVAMTESKTQAVMKRFQVTWSTGLTS